MLNEQAQPALSEGQVTPSYWAISIRRLLRKKVGVTCLVIIAIMYGSGILAPLVTPYGYNDQDLSITKQTPSFSHPYATDRYGRDNPDSYTHLTLPTKLQV